MALSENQDPRKKEKIDAIIQMNWKKPPQKLKSPEPIKLVNQNDNDRNSTSTSPDLIVWEEEEEKKTSVRLWNKSSDEQFIHRENAWNTENIPRVNHPEPHREYRNLPAVIPVTDDKNENNTGFRRDLPADYPRPQSVYSKVKKPFFRRIEFIDKRVFREFYLPESKIQFCYERMFPGLVPEYPAHLKPSVAAVQQSSTPDLKRSPVETDEETPSIPKVPASTLNPEIPSFAPRSSADIIVSTVAAAPPVRRGRLMNRNRLLSSSTESNPQPEVTDRSISNTKFDEFTPNKDLAELLNKMDVTRLKDNNAQLLSQSLNLRDLNISPEIQGNCKENSNTFKLPTTNIPTAAVYPVMGSESNNYRMSSSQRDTRPTNEWNVENATKPYFFEPPTLAPNWFPAQETVLKPNFVPENPITSQNLDRNYCANMVPDSHRIANFRAATQFDQNYFVSQDMRDEEICKTTPHQPMNYCSNMNPAQMTCSQPLTVSSMSFLTFPPEKMNAASGFNTQMSAIPGPSESTGTVSGVVAPQTGSECVNVPNLQPSQFYSCAITSSTEYQSRYENGVMQAGNYSSNFDQRNVQPKYYKGNFHPVTAITSDGANPGSDVPVLCSIPQNRVDFQEHMGSYPQFTGNLTRSSNNFQSTFDVPYTSYNECDVTDNANQIAFDNCAAPPEERTMNFAQKRLNLFRQGLIPKAEREALSKNDNQRVPVDHEYCGEIQKQSPCVVISDSFTNMKTYEHIPSSPNQFESQENNNYTTDDDRCQNLLLQSASFCPANPYQEYSQNENTTDDDRCQNLRQQSASFCPANPYQENSQNENMTDDDECQNLRQQSANFGPVNSYQEYSQNEDGQNKWMKMKSPNEYPQSMDRMRGKENKVSACRDRENCGKPGKQYFGDQIHDFHINKVPLAGILKTKTALTDDNIGFYKAKKPVNASLMIVTAKKVSFLET